MATLRKLLLGISPRETSAAVRGFPERDAPGRPRLERIGATFVEGYTAALEDPEPVALAQRLERVADGRRGFAWEGAAMALALLDALTPWRRGRFTAALAGPGEPHAYLMWVGLGWARARLRLLRGVDARPAPGDDPLLGWLAFDGFGFHEGFFRWERSFVRRERPRGLSGPAARVFDQGLGRCAWFVFGARVEPLAACFDSFAPERREDLWGGVGLAAAYAGGVDEDALRTLAARAGEHRAALGQGAAFAAQARQRANDPSEDTERACRTFFRSSARDAAQWTQVTAESLPHDADEPAYLVWRARLRDLLLERERHAES